MIAFVLYQSCLCLSMLVLLVDPCDSNYIALELVVHSFGVTLHDYFVSLS